MTARTLTAILAAGTLLVGCSKEEEKPAGTPGGETPTGTVKEPAGDTTGPLEEAAGGVKEAVEGAKEDLAGQFEELKAKAVAEAENRMTALETQLKDLETKLGGAAEPLKAAAQPLVDSAKAKYAEISPKIDALKAAGSDAWETASQQLTDALDALEQAINEATSKLGG